MLFFLMLFNPTTEVIKAVETSSYQEVRQVLVDYLDQGWEILQIMDEEGCYYATHVWLM